MKKLFFFLGYLALSYCGFSQYSPPIEFLHSSYGLGYGSKIYPTDEGNGVTNLRIAVRGNSTTWTDAMVFRAADANGGGLGNIGIGTITPASRLHVQGGTLGSNVGDRVPLFTLQNLSGSGGNWSYVDMFAYRNAAGSDWLTASSRIQQTIDVTRMAFVEFNPPSLLGGLALGTSDVARLYITGNGQVGIGTSTPGSYQLAVEGKIGARQMQVTLANPWPDYVFYEQYPLISLPNLENYIRKNNHLPDMPSAQEVKDNGIELGQMNAKLLEKIEELTLYVVELNKKVEQQQKEIAALQKPSH